MRGTECTPTLTRDRLQSPPRHRRAEAADDEHHDHGAGDDAEDASGAVMRKEELDDIAGEDRAEPAPGIDEAHSLRADARRVELGLIGMEGEGEPIRRERDQEAADDEAGLAALLRE